MPLWLAAAALAFAAPDDAKTLSPPNGKVIGDLRTIAKAATAGDCETVVRLGVPLIEGSEIKTLSPELRDAGFVMVVGCEATIGRLSAAFRHSETAVTLGAESDGLWDLHLKLALAESKHQAAVRAIEVMASKHPERLGSVRIAWIFGALRDMKKAGETDLRFRALTVLTSPAYRPVEVPASIDAFRRDLILMLMARGDVDGARRLVGQIEMPEILIDLSLDRTARSLFERDPDVRLVAERYLATVLALQETNRDRIRPTLAAASMLRLLGRPAEALALLEASRPQLKKPEALKDADALEWWWDELGRAQSALNRPDAAFDAYGRGAQIDEDGALNVSQVINLATVQVEAGRSADALKTLKAFDDPKRRASPFGDMQMRLARGCARFLTNDLAGATADRDYMVAHEADSPEALTLLWMCRGDADAAAAAFVRRLDNPDEAAGALRQLSDFAPPPVVRPPNPFDRLLPAIKARADVQAAIARAGGIRRFNVRPPDS